MFWAGTQAYHWSDINLRFWNDYTEYVAGSMIQTQFPKSNYKENVSDPAGTVLEGDYMMHYYPVGDTYELYNIKQDPGEANNLASEFPDKVKAMKAAFDKWIISMDKPVEWKIGTWKKLLPKS